MHTYKEILSHRTIKTLKIRRQPSTKGDQIVLLQFCVRLVFSTGSILILSWSLISIIPPWSPSIFARQRKVNVYFKNHEAVFHHKIQFNNVNWWKLVCFGGKFFHILMLIYCCCVFLLFCMRADLRNVFTLLRCFPFKWSLWEFNKSWTAKFDSRRQFVKADFESFLKAFHSSEWLGMCGPKLWWFL